MDIPDGLDAEARAAHLVLHGYVEPARPLTLRTLRQAAYGMRECRVLISLYEIEHVVELPMFVPAHRYGLKVAGPHELGAIENIRFDLEL